MPVAFSEEMVDGANGEAAKEWAKSHFATCHKMGNMIIYCTRIQEYECEPPQEVAASRGKGW